MWTTLSSPRSLPQCSLMWSLTSSQKSLISYRYTGSAAPQAQETKKDKKHIAYESPDKPIVDVMNRLEIAFLNVVVDTAIEILKDRFETLGDVRARLWGLLNFKKLDIEITKDMWLKAWEIQSSSTNSWSWRAFCWKNLINFFTNQKWKKQTAAQLCCWRKCGEIMADHAHVFWSCPPIQSFWKEVATIISRTLGFTICTTFTSLYHGQVELLSTRCF